MDATVRNERGAGWHRIVLVAAANQNKLTPQVVEALWNALVACEQDPSAQALIIEGSDGYFCSGMDLAAAADEPAVKGAGGDRFAQLLKKISESSVVVISVVDGRASGGGVGLAAASDYVFATPNSQFSLPEILWGLVPCLIAPFLIRRIGFQACLRMTLSTLPMSAENALAVGLVDALDSRGLAQLLQRLRLVAPEGIGKAKRYLGRLSLVSDATLEFALDELEQILGSPEVRQRLQEFARNHRYPWESAAARQPHDGQSRPQEVGL